MSTLNTSARRDEVREITPLDVLRAGMGTVFTPAQVRAVPRQHAHYLHGEYGRALFPLGEATVVAAPGRAGKTLTMLSLLMTASAGEAIGDLRSPADDRVAIIYSAEDDVHDYMRAVAAQQVARGWSDAQLARVLNRIRIPDLRGERARALRTLLTLGPDRLPVTTAAVDYIIKACRGLRVGVIVFETVSKLMEVEESNVALKRLVAAVERIAEALECAVVIVHHTSQASLSALRDLDLSTAAIRGGTALPDDARQTAMVVNLGSRNEPVGDGDDSRTRLREVAFPGNAVEDNERVGVYVTLDSSKSARPRPIFLRWMSTEWGPAPLVTPSTAGDCARCNWEQLVQYARGGKRSGKRGGKVPVSGRRRDED